MPLQFHKATKAGSKLKLLLTGPAGSGKTYTALRIATHLANGKGRIAVIDTEHGSASKYADQFEFDKIDLPSFDPRLYVEAIKAAIEARYDVLIIDSLSHEWIGKGGALEIVDRSRSTNKFAAWGEVTPLHNEFVDTIVGAPVHLIGTARSKMEYTLEEYEDGGKKKSRPVKLGMAPVQRDGVEYEFDVILDLDLDHIGRITKTRAPKLDGGVFEKPGPEFADLLQDWLKGDPLPDSLRKQFHATGTQTYGDQWNSKRPELVRWVSADRTDSSDDLTVSEMQRLVDGMSEKLKETTEPMIANDTPSEEEYDRIANLPV